MNQFLKTKSLLFTVTLFAYALLSSSCCSSNKSRHDLKATNDTGDKYDVTHTLIGDCTGKNHHTYVSEFSTEEAQVTEAIYTQKINAHSFTPSQVKKVVNVTRSYNAHGFIVDEACSTIENKYIKDILRSNGYTDIKGCSNPDPAVGDIVIYQFKNLVNHSGQVISVSIPENPKVHSKWGVGPEYEHDLTVVDDTFDKIIFYRKGCL